MKNICLTIAGVLVAGLLPSASASDTPETTQLLTGSIAATNPYSKHAAQPRDYSAWKLSLLPVVASQAVDVSSSYGMRESNPLLAGADGRFGTQAAVVKLGLTGALIGMEYLLIRKHPGAAKILWKVNLGSAAVTGVVAGRNYSVR